MKGWMGKMQEIIKAVIKQPGKKPEIREIENKLSVLQAEVDGYIETVTLGHGLVLICNEEGRIRGMPHNFGEFVGPVVIVGQDEDEFRGLTEDEAESLMDLLS